MALRTSILRLVVGLLTPSLLLAAPLYADPQVNLYVSAERGGNKNPGTKEAPFKDIQAALERAPEGARIHVAQGTYTGRLKAGQYIIKQASIELIGGYTDDFTKRNPFVTRTLIADDPERKHPDTQSGGTLRLIGDGEAVTEMKHLVVDGFVFDQGNKNSYSSGPTLSDMRDNHPIIKINVSYDGADITVRNNVLVNGGWEGITVFAKPNSRTVIENNIIINVVKDGIYIAASPKRNDKDRDADVIIRNNTIAYTWQQLPPTPADPFFGRGSAIELSRHGKALIEKNILAHGSEGGIFNDLNKQVTAKGNVFFDNYLSDYTFFISGAKTNARAAEFDDTDLAGDGNLGIDPDFEGLDEQYRRDRANFVFSYPENLAKLYSGVTEAELALAAGSTKPGPESQQDVAIKNKETGQTVDTLTVRVKKYQDRKYWGIRYPVEKALIFPRSPKAVGAGAQRTVAR